MTSSGEGKKGEGLKVGALRSSSGGDWSFSLSIGQKMKLFRHMKLTMQVFRSKKYESGLNLILSLHTL